MKKNINTSSFPSHNVSKEEKDTEKYGIEVARAIKRNWWEGSFSNSSFGSNYNNFHNLIIGNLTAYSSIFSPATNPSIPLSSYRFLICFKPDFAITDLQYFQ